MDEKKCVVYRDVKYDSTKKQYLFDIAKRAKLLSVHIDREFHRAPVFRFSFLVNVGATITTKYFNIFEAYDKFSNMTIMDYITSVGDYHIFQIYKEQT
jgi:hypothetical protein